MAMMVEKAAQLAARGSWRELILNARFAARPVFFCSKLIMVEAYLRIFYFLPMTSAASTPKRPAGDYAA
jgi:hypothetical protein